MLKFSAYGYSSEEEEEEDGNPKEVEERPQRSCSPRCPPGELEIMVEGIQGLSASMMSYCSRRRTSGRLSGLAKFVAKHAWGDETVNGVAVEEGAVQMVLLNLPSGISVYGIDDEIVPAWNTFSPTLIEAGMLIASTVLCDNGWVACIHTGEQRRQVEDAATNAGLESSRTFTLVSTKPIYRQLRQPEEKVYDLNISVFYRGGVPRPKPYYMQAGEMGHQECSLSRSLLVDNVNKEDWLRMADGRPWRGGAQRSSNIWRFLVLAFTKYGDTVVDLIAGTGGFVKMASDLGRHALAVESDIAIVERVLKPLKRI